MRIAVYGRQQSTSVIPYVEQLMVALESHQCEILLYQPFLHFLQKHSSKKYKHQTFSSNTDLRHQVDVIFSVGGDGTMLDTLTLVQDSMIPVAGVNTGRLGF
ncbi:MAG TPA: NAD(+)/NADH kinase, partial [Bacteroidia bacterium]|nr:NAD(+)/NADH kinase [Bacteroidia bacterium]